MRGRAFNQQPAGHRAYFDVKNKGGGGDTLFSLKIVPARTLVIERKNFCLFTIPSR